MIALKDTPLGEPAHDRFARLAADVSAAEAEQFQARLPEAARRARAAARHWDFGAPAKAVTALLDDLQAFPAAREPAHRARLQKAAVARLLLGHFAVHDPMPPSVIAEYERLWTRISAYMAGLEGPYPGEYLAKDVRFALGLSVPCGTLAIDLEYYIGPKLIARAAAHDRSLRPVLDYLRAGGWGRWYNDHMDTRDLSAFNAAGWTACFRIFAEVLALNPSVRGITGVSWFYDPKVCTVSPNLAYIQAAQAAHGAFQVRVGSSAIDVHNATTRSATRRRLYEEGAYRPTSYLIAWPRRPLLRWAGSVERDPASRFEAWAPARARAAPALASA